MGQPHFYFIKKLVPTYEQSRKIAIFDTFLIDSQKYRSIIMDKKEE